MHVSVVIDCMRDDLVEGWHNGSRSVAQSLRTLGFMRDRMTSVPLTKIAIAAWSAMDDVQLLAVRWTHRSRMLTSNAKST